MRSKLGLGELYLRIFLLPGYLLLLRYFFLRGFLLYGRNFFCQVFLFPGRVPLLYRFRLLTLKLLSSGFLPLAPLVAFFAYFGALSLWSLFDNDRAALRFYFDGGGSLRAEVVVIVCDRTAWRVGLRRAVESNRLLGLNDALRGNFNSVVVCFGQRGL